MAAFWGVAPRTLVEVDRRFRATTLIMEAVSTSETSVSLYQPTPLYIPKDSHFFTRQPLKMETACFSETSASTCKYTWRQNPRPLQQHDDDNHHERLKSHRIFLLVGVRT
jgi:hypothetical protein